MTSAKRNLRAKLTNIRCGQFTSTGVQNMSYRAAALVAADGVAMFSCSLASTLSFVLPSFSSFESSFDSFSCKSELDDVIFVCMVFRLLPLVLLLLGPILVSEATICIVLLLL